MEVQDTTPSVPRYSFVELTVETPQRGHRDIEKVPSPKDASSASICEQDPKAPSPDGGPQRSKSALNKPAFPRADSVLSEQDRLSTLSHRQRWRMLLPYGLAIFSLQLSYLWPLSLEQQFDDHFHTHSDHGVVFKLFLASPIPVAMLGLVIVPLVVVHLGMKRAVVGALSVTLGGTILEFVGVYLVRLELIFAGYALIGAGIALLCTPTHFVSTWFLPRERSLGVGVVFIIITSAKCVGVAIGSTLVSIVTGQSGGDVRHGDDSINGGNMSMHWVLVSLASVTFISLIVVLWIFRRAPVLAPPLSVQARIDATKEELRVERPTSASGTPTVSRNTSTWSLWSSTDSGQEISVNVTPLSFFRVVKILLKTRETVVLIVTHMLLKMALDGLGVVVYGMVRAAGYSFFTNGALMSTHSIMGAIGCGILMVYLYRASGADSFSVKKTMIFCMVGFAAGNIWTVAAFLPENQLSVYGAFALLGFMGYTAEMICYEAMAEIAFPLIDCYTIAIMSIPSQFGLAIAITVIAALEHTDNGVMSGFVMAACSLIGVFLIYFLFHPRTRRHAAMRREEQQNTAAADEDACVGMGTHAKALVRAQTQTKSKSKALGAHQSIWAALRGKPQAVQWGRTQPKH